MTDDPDRATFRADHGVPDDAAGCHTAMVEGYAIEGHVPVEAIVQLLADRPQAAGLALPGMPGNAPGMGGDGDSWAAQPVVLVNSDGSLTDYSY